MASYEDMSSADLRKKLLECGYDLPTCINKDFMIKKLEQVCPKGFGQSQSINQGNNFMNNNPPPACSPNSDYGKGISVSTRSSRVSMNNNASGYSDGLMIPKQDTISPTVQMEPKPKGGRGRKSTMQEIPPIKVETPPTPSGRAPRKSKAAAAPKRARMSASSAANPMTPEISNDYSSAPPGAVGMLKPYKDAVSNMFGLIIPGRIVQADFIRNQENGNELPKYKVDIPNADVVDHIVVFLTGTEPFPPGTAGQVYFGWPDLRNEISWHLLGHITNELPSAIFKVSELKKNVVNPNQLNQTMTFTNQQHANGSSPHIAQIGISVELLEVILQSYSPQMQL